MTFTILQLTVGPVVAAPHSAGADVSTLAPTDAQSPSVNRPLRSLEDLMSLDSSTQKSYSYSEDGHDDGIAAPLVDLVSILVLTSLLSGGFLLIPYQQPKLISVYSPPLPQPG
jgi:hypothetical protein